MGFEVNQGLYDCVVSLVFKEYLWISDIFQLLWKLIVTLKGGLEFRFMFTDPFPLVTDLPEAPFDQPWDFSLSFTGGGQNGGM